MSDEPCPYCNRPLMRIDHYGDVLIGCVDCNRWGQPGKKLIMELLEGRRPFVVNEQRPSASSFVQTLLEI